MTDYDANADKAFNVIPRGTYQIKAFRGEEMNVTVEWIPRVTMAIGDNSIDVAGMMPRVRQQIAQRILERLCEQGCHPLPQGITEEVHAINCFYRTVLKGEWIG